MAGDRDDHGRKLGKHIILGTDSRRQRVGNVRALEVQVDRRAQTALAAALDIQDARDDQLTLIFAIS